MKLYNILPLTLAALALTACSGKDEKKNASAEENTLPVVKVAQVDLRTVDQIGTYTATVEAQIVNNISSSMPNRIKQIFVDEGQQVSAGQKVAILDDVNTFSYETQVDNAKANLRNVEVNYNRAVELLKIGGGTKQQVDNMEIQLVNAKNQLAQAERTLRNARENTVLTSPISGVVTARNYDPGDMTGSLPILTIEQLRPVKVMVNVSESEYPKVHDGMKVEIKADVYPDETFTGTVHLIHPTIDPATRTFTVEITIDNADERIRPGMFARVIMNFGLATHVVVPDRAVVKQSGSGNKYVYVFNPSDSTVSYNQVTLGQRIDNAYEIQSGVPADAFVVITGQTRLADDVKVDVLDRNADNAEQNK